MRFWRFYQMPSQSNMALEFVFIKELQRSWVVWR
jgi:hypothetical protein